MPVNDITHKILGHTNPKLSTAAEISEYIIYKKDVELERNL